VKDKQKRILIVRQDRLGDVILSTPLPREIKKKFPDAYIAVLVKNYTKAVYENNPYVDSIILYDDYPQESFSDFLRKTSEIRKHKFTHAFMILPDERINYMLFFAGIPNRYGTGWKLFQAITSVKSVSRNKYIPLRHEADYALDFARKLGIKTFDCRTEIYLTEQERNEALLRKKMFCPAGERLIAVHSTYGMSTPNMPVEEYRKLILKLVKVPGIKVMVTDFKLPEEINGIENVLYLSRSGRDFFIDIAMADLLISSSTGPSHAAAALGVPTLTLFCRLPAASAMLWSPMGNDANFVFPDEEYCANKCPNDVKVCRFQGNGGINAEKVFEKTLEILAINQDNNS
jgi:heptosyltransferase-3